MRLSVILSMIGLFCSGSAVAQGVLAGQVVSPFPVPMGEGFFRISSAEPLGKGNINIRYLTEGYDISVRKVGEGSSLTGHFGMGYGLSKNIDLSLGIPILFDMAGGLAKYGSGDINSTLKFGFPSKFPSTYHYGFAFSVVMPYGYKGRQALNVRPYSRRKKEISSQLLFDLNRKSLGIHLNLGYLLSSGSREGAMAYGMSMEIGRGQVFTVIGEYLSEPSALGRQTQRAILGAHMNLWRFRFEAGLEKGLSDDLPNVSAIVGLRVNTSFSGKGKRSIRPRNERGIISQDIGSSARVVVVNFSGFSNQKVGERVADRIRTELTRSGHIRVLEVGDRAEFLDPDSALQLATQVDADVVITGRIRRFEMDRSSKPNLPLVFGVPQTVAYVEADFRLVSPEQKEVFSGSLVGTGRRSRGVKMFPTTIRDDRTDYLSVLEKDRVWNEAIQQMVDQFLKEMAGAFSWFRD